MLETTDSILIILFLGTASLILFFAGMLLFIFKYQKKVLLHHQQLIKIEEDKQKELLSAVIESQENTQNFIAKELHDGILQEMATLRFGTAHIANQLNKLGLPLDNVNSLKNDIDLSIKNIRELSHSILPSILEQEGLAVALESVVNKINTSPTLKAHCWVNGNSFQQPKTEELAFFRIAQEAIQNTIKYADATTITIELKFNEKKCTMIVADNGKGFDTSTKNLTGVGIKNMQSRAKVIDALLTITSILNNGTTIIVEKTYI